LSASSTESTGTELAEVTEVSETTGTTSTTGTAAEGSSPAPPRSRRTLAIVGAVVALVVVAAAAVVVLRRDGDDTPAGGAFGSDLAVVGDSFLQQANPQLDALTKAQGTSLQAFGLGGTSICHFAGVFDDLAAAPPRVLVLSFAGNDLPHTCFNPTGEVRDAETVAANYRPQLDEVVRRFMDLGSKVYVVLPPPIRDAQYEARASAMRELYRSTHDDEPNLRLIDSATTLDPDGQGFVESLPCEDWDVDCPASGQIVLRQDDGIHLTPAGGERYARAILDAVTPELPER
jgi:hypothetical protein